MPTYRLTVQETVWHTFEFKTDVDLDVDAVRDFFYNMEEDEQKAALRGTESFEWTVDEVEKLED